MDAVSIALPKSLIGQGLFPGKRLLSNYCQAIASCSGNKSGISGA